MTTTFDNGITAFYWLDGKIDLIYNHQPIGGITHLGEFNSLFDGVYKVAMGNNHKINACGTKLECLELIKRLKQNTIEFLL